MTLRRSVSLLGLALVSVPACSPPSDKSPEGVKSAVESSAPPSQVAATTPAPSESAIAPPQAPAASEAPSPTRTPSPLDGLTVEQISSIEKARELFGPLVSAGKDKLSDLKENERFAVAVMKLSQSKVKFDQEAETRLRTVLTDTQKANELVGQYVAILRERLPVTHELKEGSSEIISRFPVAERIAATYEKALDAGAKIPDVVRDGLGMILRSKGPATADLSVDLDKVVSELRTKLLEQTVTGDYLLLLAKAVDERRSFLFSTREWVFRLTGLIDALPSEYRTQCLSDVAWGPAREQEYLAAKERLKTEGIPSRAVFSPEGQAAYKKELEEIAEMKRKDFLALERRRRDFVEGYFYETDSLAWRAIIALDTLSSDLQKLLDAIAPDFEYRFRPVLGPELSKEERGNVLPKFTLPGKAEDVVPRIELDGYEIVFEAPGNQPRFKDVVKPGQVLRGTIRLSPVRSPYSKPDEPPLLPEMVYENVEMTVKGLDHRNEMEGRLKVTKPGTGETESLPITGGEMGRDFLNFTVVLRPPIGTDNLMHFKCRVENGLLTGPVTTQRGTERTGTFSFKPEN